MKKRKLKKPERGGKFKPKEINIDALVSNIRQTTPGFRCTECERRMAEIVSPGRQRGFSKRVYRKESLFISR